GGLVGGRRGCGLGCGLGGRRLVRAGVGAGVRSVRHCALPWIRVEGRCVFPVFLLTGKVAVDTEVSAAPLQAPFATTSREGDPWLIRTFTRPSSTPAPAHSSPARAAGRSRRSCAATQRASRRCRAR